MPSGVRLCHDICCNVQTNEAGTTEAGGLQPAHRAEAGQARRFETRTKIYASIWCCVNKHPGHVWYDLWWDKVPRVDRHNRSITGPWAPIMGP